MNIIIKRILPDTAEALCRQITQDLPEYFGLPEANEHYAIGVRSRINFAVRVDGRYVGLLSLEFPYPNNGNIYWMAVMRDYHRCGIGKKLISAACVYAKEIGASTMSVETLASSEADENYLKTYNFYKANGFQPLFNLKPGGYEWNMVYMVRDLTHFKLNLNTLQISIKPFTESHIPLIVKNFAAHNWLKTPELFESYLKEQQINERIIWLAFLKDQFVGYVTLKMNSTYVPFYEAQIPEINDFNVLPSFRGKGIGSKLLEVAETEAAKRSNIVGLGVGLHESYGNAQKLYVKRGYIPDGRGITYKDRIVEFDEKIPLDDDLVIWFTKKLR
ncbi:MAG: Acyl-CoA N-acyltransferase [Rickettsiaceae bacterium]|jgi:GNAT superfamily N-acetyltransferase|nr:Acyl-CoA N-acyltransferase [Rickettsiaceae bacterium]